MLFTVKTSLSVFAVELMACLDLVRFGFSVEFSNSPQFYRVEW